jgi:hypothetical protein
MKFSKTWTVSLMLALVAASAWAAPQTKSKKAAQKKVTVTLVRWPYT